MVEFSILSKVMVEEAKDETKKEACLYVRSEMMCIVYCSR